MQEIVSERRIKSKTFDNGDGSRSQEIHCKPIHYVNSADEIVDIDISFEDLGDRWLMTKNNYTLQVAKDFGAPWLISYRNKIKNWKTGKRGNHQIKYEPHSLRWVNSTDLSDMQVFRTQQSVQGVLVDSDYGTNTRIRYTDAFGDGIHFEVTLRRSGFKKEIVIDALNKLENPPTANHKLVAFFKYDGVQLGNNTKMVIRDDGDQTQWDEDSFKESENGFEIADDDGARSLLRPAYIESADEFPNGRQRIKVFWKKHNGFLWQAKVLPKQFLLNATYPVRADTDTTVYPDPDTETDTFDGHTFGNNWESVWATARSQTGSATYTKDDQVNSSSGLNGGSRHAVGLGYETGHGIFLFKYNIASGSTITAVEQGLWVVSYYDYDNDAYGYVRIYEHTRRTGSQTAIGTADHELQYFGDAISDSIDSTNLTADSAYVVFNYNTTGEGKITADGTDQYLHTGIAEGHDVDNQAPGNGSYNGVWHFDASEHTGTSHDPYLKITYTEASTFTPRVMFY